MARCSTGWPKSAGRGQRIRSINGTLLLATGALVFVLLILIYRSPIFWVIPLFSVLMAEAFSRFCGWAIAEAGSGSWHLARHARSGYVGNLAFPPRSESERASFG